MSSQPAISLDDLRAQIRALEGARVVRERVACGVRPVDALLGGLPSPGLVELHGPRGAGGTRLALSMLAAASQHQAVAWVDLDRTLYPPAAVALGVDPRHLLLVRPTAGQGAWAAEALLRSGCFAMVAISGAASVQHFGQRWARAAEAGASTAVVVGRYPARSLPAEVRLSVGGGQLMVLRNRGGTVGRSVPLPPWPQGADPWH